MFVPRPKTRDTVPKTLNFVPNVPAVPNLGTRDSGTPNYQIKMKTQISKITALFLNYPKMLQVWNATEFVILSDESVGFKVSTQVYKGTVIISWQDNVFFTVQFRDMELKIMGIPNAVEVLDVVKDYVENGEVWV